MSDFIQSVPRYLLPVLAAAVLIYCIVRLLQSRAPKVEPASFFDALTGKEYPITNWETSIGRSSACDIVLEYPEVSRFHAVISKQKKGWIITDTNSSSGTYIGRKRVEGSEIVRDGDEVSFAGIVMSFREK
ncbi:MAG: FHA domain-containing protein [Clostridia bacterium]|nr:FHA domain-containing protein [Clostridia bacterium]